MGWLIAVEVALVVGMLVGGWFEGLRWNGLIDRGLLKWTTKEDRS